MASAAPEIPNYAILEKLGEGGMASVWLAQRLADQRLSVVKVLHDHLSNDRIVQSRFVREAQVAAFLDHPNIARLYDAGRAEKCSYLAMEFIAGREIESMMIELAKRGQMFPPALSITVTLRVLEGLAYAHDFEDPEGTHLEIVHRDLSPRNVMLTFDGAVKIIDFGLVHTNLGDFRTAPGMIAGTLRYMSPEQATAEAIDRRSDLYTWSVVLYELLSGRPLITAAEGRTILGAVVVDVPPLLSTHNPNLPRGLDPVLAKALEKDPAHRFQDARELHDAIALASGPLGVTATSAIADFVGAISPREKLEAEQRLKSVHAARADGPAYEHTRVAEAMELEPTRAEISAPRRRSRWKQGAMLGLVAFALVFLAFALMREPAEPHEVERATPPPLPRVVAQPAPHAVEEEPIERPVKRPPLRRVEPPRVRSTAPIETPPQPARSGLELADAFKREAEAKLGPAGTQLYYECFAGELATKGDVEALDKKCRAKLDALSGK